MKVVKPTFESFLEEVDEVFIRIDRYENTLTLVAGGINTSGTWIEFASKLDSIKTLSDIARSLKIMVYFVEEEQKHWDLEKPHHVLIR
ncbi:MAG: hypothetical protein AAF620_12315 [Bacteroidota bacterium]